MAVGDPFHDGEAEPRPVAGGRDAGVEHRLAQVGRDPGTVVGDEEPPRTVADDHGDVGRPVVDPVAEQVLEQLFETPLVGADPRVGLDRQRRPARLDGAPAVAGDVVERHRCRLDRRRPLVGEREEVGDQLQTAVQRDLDVVEVFVVALLSREFEPAGRDVQRVAEVVGEDVAELLEPFVLAPEFPSPVPPFRDVLGDGETRLRRRPVFADRDDAHPVVVPGERLLERARLAGERVAVGVLQLRRDRRREQVRGPLPLEVGGRETDGRQSLSPRACSGGRCRT
nr:hypothetical protein [Halobaculum sp. DT31]